MRKKGWWVLGLAALMVVLGLKVASSQVNRVGAQISLDSARDRVVNEVYKGRLENRALFAGAQIRAKGTRIADWRNPSKLIVNEDSWFFFVDELPGANWEHQARYILVNKTSGAVSSVAAKTPPTDILTMRAMNPEAVSQMAVLKRNVEFTAKAIAVKPGIFALRQKAYAVLLSGGWNSSYNYGLYWNDLSFIYKTLKTKYKYSDAEIIVL